MGRPGMGHGPAVGGPGSGKPSLRKGLVALKNSDFRLLWMSSVASFIAMQMQMVARGWLAFELTGSFTAVGIITVSWGIPMLLFSLVGGAVADRMDKRTLIIISQIGMGALALITAVLIVTDQISIPILFVMGLAQGTLFAFNWPARGALVPEIVGKQQLMSAIAVSNAAMNGTRIFGPAVAGVLIAAWGVGAAYWVQSAMYLLVLTFVFRLPRSTAHLESADERGNVFQEIGVGISYISREKMLRMLMLMAFVPTALGFSYFVLLPGFAVNDLGLAPGSYGVLFTFTGVGALVGSLFVASFTEFPRKGLLQVVAGFGYGGALLGLGLLSVAFGFPGALAALAVLGLFSSTYMALNNTLIMMNTHPDFYGRVMSIYMLTFSGMTFVAAPLGAVADRIGATTTFNMLGIGIVAFFVLVVVVAPKYVFGVTEVAYDWDDDEWDEGDWGEDGAPAAAGGAGGNGAEAGAPAMSAATSAAPSFVPAGGDGRSSGATARAESEAGD